MAKKRYAMLTDLRRCIGCHSCAVACKTENRVPLGVWQTHVKYQELKTASGFTRKFLPNHCNHCSDPPCVAASGGAMVQRKDGVTLFTGKKKENLANSLQACPYQNISMDPVSKGYFKCTFCSHRIDKGLVPACVQTCLGRAKIFGDTNDRNSEISRLLRKNKAVRLKVDAETKPNFYYIGMEEAVKNWEKTIEGFRQWKVDEIERQVSTNV